MERIITKKAVNHANRILKLFAEQKKERLLKERGNTHNWKYTSVHHGWTYWHTCKYCGKTIQDSPLREGEKTEPCTYFE